MRGRGWRPSSYCSVSTVVDCGSVSVNISCVLQTMFYAVEPTCCPWLAGHTCNGAELSGCYLLRHIKIIMLFGVSWITARNGIMTSGNHSLFVGRAGTCVLKLIVQRWSSVGPPVRGLMSCMACVDSEGSCTSQGPVDVVHHDLMAAGWARHLFIAGPVSAFHTIAVIY